MWRRWADFDADRPLRPWLTGIAARVAHDHRKRRWREVPGGQLDPLDAAAHPDDRLAAARARALVQQALVNLPERHRSMVLMTMVDGLSGPEIADQLELPLATAYTRIRRARLAFTDEVARLQSDSRGRLRALVTRACAGDGPLWVARAAALGALVAVVVLAGGALPRSSPDAAPPGSPELARDLVGYWPFDDLPASATARDLSPGAHDCALHDIDPAAARVEGRHGRAIDLGGGGWLECAQPELPDGTPAPALSISLWVKRARIAPAHQALVSREMEPSHEDFIFFGFDRDRLKATSHAWLGRVGAELPGEIGRWSHLALTHAADGTAKLYADGVEVATNHVGHRTMRGGRAPLMVGAGFARADRQVRQRFEGAIDELALYTRALSAAEVRLLAAGAQPGAL
jgi:RNA polymerase sigma-70 factor (ECF subfamily)